MKTVRNLQVDVSLSVYVVFGSCTVCTFLLHFVALYCLQLLLTDRRNTCTHTQLHDMFADIFTKYKFTVRYRCVKLTN